MHYIIYLFNIGQQGTLNIVMLLPNIRKGRRLSICDINCMQLHLQLVHHNLSPQRLQLQMTQTRLHRRRFQILLIKQCIIQSLASHINVCCQRNQKNQYQSVVSLIVRYSMQHWTEPGTEDIHLSGNDDCNSSSGCCGH